MSSMTCVGVWLSGAIALLLLVPDTASIRWLEIGLQYNREQISAQTYDQVSKSQKTPPSVLERHKIMSSTTAFNKRQKRLLKQTGGLYPALQRSAARTIFTCQAAFSESRWNCSSLSHLPDLSPELDSGTREQAYVYALSSALLVTDVARACASGDIKGCPCRAKKKRASRDADEGADGVARRADRDFQIEGCGLSYKPGLRLAMRFINAGLKGKTKGRLTGGDDSAWTKQHNSQFGAQAVARAMEKKCKCHGLSGSCEIMTCWKSVNEQKLLTELKVRYNSAQALVQQKRPDEVASGGHGKRDTQDEGALLFNRISSDYCNPDPLSGSYGTRYRECGGPEKNNCDWMCCGRGHTESTITRTERCRCRHVWCCYVECDTCDVSATIYHCK